MMQQDLSQQVISEIKSGRKISAIKLLREEQGIGLKQAKETVDGYIETNAEVKEAFYANQPDGLSQGSVVKLIVVILVLVGYYFYQR